MILTNRPFAMNVLVKYFCPIALFLMLSCGSETKKADPETSITGTEETDDRPDKEQEKIILFFGNSLTAGLGVLPEESFPSLIQKTIDSTGAGYTVVNAGLSGDTTASGKNRLEWILNQDVTIFFLELGANDGLRGIPLDETRKNLEAIINAVLNKNEDVVIVLAGMQLPPNLGPEYTASFKEIYPELAKQEQVILVPFLLKDVGGNPALNQEDGIHPTSKGHQVIAKTIWPYIQQAMIRVDSRDIEPVSERPR